MFSTKDINPDQLVDATGPHRAKTTEKQNRHFQQSLSQPAERVGVLIDAYAVPECFKFIFVSMLAINTKRF